MTSIGWPKKICDVFNIEVNGHHVYRITNDGILVHNNSSAGNLAKSEMQRAVAVATTAAKNFKNLQCDECVTAMLKALKEAGLPKAGTLIKLQTSNGAPIYSHSIQTLISCNDYHTALQVGDKIIDCNNHNGVLPLNFMRDLVPRMMDRSAPTATMNVIVPKPGIQ